MPVYKDEKRGTWYVRFKQKDWTGQTRAIWKRGFSSKREAVQWELDYKSKQKGSLNMTFAQFVDVYKQDRINRIKESTMTTKENIISIHIVPYFETRRISDITPADIIKWQNHIMSRTDKKGKKFSKSFLKTIHNQLSAILNHAAWLSIAFSIFGLFLLALDHLSGEIFGVLIAFASAVAYSYDLICLDKSRIGRMSASKKVFYLTMARIVAVAVTNFLSMEQYSFAADQLIYCAIVGLGKSVAMLAFSKGLAQVGSSRASFVSALEPIVSLFVSKFVYGYALGLDSYLGCFFIVTATFFFVRNR